MKKQRTKAEIDRQIEGLIRMKSKFPEFTSFGDKNWEKIDAQISVIRGESVPDDYYQDEHSEDYQDGDNDIWSEAERASEWKEGYEDEDLFE